MQKVHQCDPSHDLLWLSLGLMPLLLIALLLPLTPHDYWWYLRLGKDILQTGSVPTIETYSFTHFGESVIYRPWLSALIFWLAYSNGGMDFTFLLRALCVGLTYGSLWVWMRQLDSGPRLASILILVAGLAGSNNWSFRPQMFAYPLFALLVLIFWKWHQEDTKFIWFLPMIGFLWANLHDSFLLLFLLAGAALLFGHGNRRTLIPVVFLTLLATLVNPQGTVLWVSIIRSLVSPLSWNLSAEWFPPTNSGWQMNIFFAWVLLFAPLASFSARRLTILEWAWLSGLLWMSFSGIRYVIWGLFMLAAFSARLLSMWDARWLDRPAAVFHPALNNILAVAFLLIPLLALPGVRAGLGIKSAPAISPDTPIAATEWLSLHPELPGPLWSDLTFSSYLIFALPSRPVWIDTRFEMIYSAEQYQLFNDIASAAPDWQALLDQEQINLLMISVYSQPRLLQALSASAQWCEQYRDSLAVIFARRQTSPFCH
jgi:hypothetical protein